MSLLPSASAVTGPSRLGVAAPGLETRAVVGASAQATGIGRSDPPALFSAVQAAAALQDGAAPLFADLAAALLRPDLPDRVRAAAVQVLTAGLPIDDAPTADELRTAVAQSGLFLEADLATGEAPAPGDLKAALIDLSAQLGPTASPAAAMAGPPSAPLYPGTALQPQPPATSALPPDAGLELVMAQLARRTAAALSRQLLSQAASIRPSATAAGQPTRWLFDLPLLAPEGASTAPFEVERDSTRREAEGDAAVWRTRFCFSVGSIGPVHAQLSLQGERLRIGLWTEDPSAAAELDSNRDALLATLRADQFDPQVLVQTGAPRPVAPPAGALLSRTV
jgi:hypothetical protein